MKKNDYIQAKCPSEDEMRKELELHLIEKLGIGELLLKAYDEGKKAGYNEGYSEGYGDGEGDCDGYDYR